MEVRFTNFRCFKDTGSLKLKKLTFLVGENSSGKTSFLAGVNHVSKLISGEESVDGNIGPNAPPFNLGGFKDIVHFGNKKVKASDCFIYKFRIQDAEWNLEFISDNQEITISKVAINSPSQREFGSFEFDVRNRIIRIEVDISDKEINAFRFYGARVDKVSRGKASVVSIERVSTFFRRNRVFSIRSLQRSLYFATIMRYQRKANMHPDFFEDNVVEKNVQGELDNRIILNRFLDLYFHRMNQLVVHRHLRSVALSPLRSEPQRHYSLVDYRPVSLDPSGANFPLKFFRNASANLASHRAVIREIERFGKNSGLFKSVSVKSIGNESGYLFSLMVETMSGEKSNIMDVGYGTSQILPLIYESLTFDQRKRFLIQQPEVHLHPKAQAEFASLLPKIIEKGCEFLIETHSDYIIDRIKYEICEGRIRYEDVGILFFEASSDGVQIHQVNLGADGIPLNAPRSYRKFFLDELNKVWP